METWQFWALMIVLYLCADRIGRAIEQRKDDK